MPSPARPPVVPGCRAEEFVARGGHGEVWRGRHLETGRPVALKLIREAAGGLLLRAEVAATALLAGPHVTAVIDLRLAGDGSATVVTEWAAGGSLADLLAARGRLTPGEVVTLLVPLATVLAEAHARLLTHGDVSPGNVLFTGTGRPMLADWGLARALAEAAGAGAGGTPGYTDPAVLAGAPAGPAADVAGLAAVAYAALAARPPWEGDSGGRPSLHRLAPVVPPRLADAIEAGLAARPEDRPAAADFAAAAREACDPAPVMLPRHAAAADLPRTAQRPRQPGALSPPAADSAPTPRPLPGRRAVTALLAALTGLVLLGVLAGTGWSRIGARGGAVVVARRPVPATSPTRPPPAPAGGHIDVARLVQRLVQRLAGERVRAISRGRPDALRRVYAPGTAPLRRDRRTIQGLRSRGLTARGLQARVLSVHLVEPAPAVGPGSVVAEVEDALSSYRLVDARTGRTVALGAARPREVLRVTLRHTSAGWRIVALRPG